jgi:SAM-dependent methyltransferase
VETYDLALLERSRERWQASPALRVYYGDLYRAMAAVAVPGPALEIGSGCGTMREFVSGVVTSDVRQTRYVEVAASAYELERVAGGPWATLYALDVLHHLREPRRFLASAAGVLRPAGRLVLVEPAATPFGRCFYGLCHHEPMAPGRLRAPYQFAPDGERGDFANMGMAWALFVRDRSATLAWLHGIGLAVVEVRFRDVLAYPGTGGFSGPRLLPAAVVRGLLAVEVRLPQAVLRWLGLRMMIVIEKRAS